MGSAERQGELWGRAPAGWAELQEPMHAPLWTAMLDAAEVTEGTRLLDAGCGGGGASDIAARRGADVIGLDAAQGLVEIARQRVPAAEFRVGDLEQLPFDDGAFDVVLAANSVQYAQDRVQALRELRRVCSKGGRVVASLFGPPDRVAYADVLRAFGGVMPEPARGGGPFELSSPGALESVMEQAGLEIDASGEVNCVFSYPDVETYWNASAAAGPAQSIMEVVDADVLRAAATDAIKDFLQPDGSVVIGPNIFRYVVASA